MSSESSVAPPHPSLGASPDRYRSVFEHAPLAMWTFDVETLRILDANAAALAQYGYDRASFLALTVRDLRLPEDTPPDLGLMEPSPARLLPRGEFRHRTRDGRILHVAVSSQPWMVEGRPARLVVAVDVTARRQDERRVRLLSRVMLGLAAARDETATLARLAELAAAELVDLCAVHVPAPDGRLALLALAGAPDGLEGAMRRLHATPDGDAALALQRAVLRTGRARRLRRRSVERLVGLLPPGAARDVCDAVRADSLLCIPVLAGGRVLGVLTLVRRSGRQALDRLDRALGLELAAHAGLAVENARLLEAERRARQAAERERERSERLQGVTAALSEALMPAEVAQVFVTMGVPAVHGRAGAFAMLSEDGRHLDLLAAVGYPPELVEPFRRIAVEESLPLCDAVRSGAPVWLLDRDARRERYPHLLALRDDGGARGEALLAAVPLVVEGRAIGVVGLSFPHDLAHTDEDLSFLRTLARQSAIALERARLYEAERRARAAMEAARLEAEAANRAKTEFLAVMSHELRTPLNAIAGYTELLELGIRGPVTAEQLTDLARIRRSQQHLLGLINDILNYARLERGTVRYEFESLRVGEALAEVEPLVLPQVAARGLRLELEPVPDELLARADREKLRQILLNLVSNAVKFTEPGGVIALAGGASPPGDGPVTGAHVWLEVRDTGCGIPVDRQEAIFEPFVQLDKGLTRRAEGTGLGLAISRDLARAMGGELTVRSEAGRGATFRVELPEGAGW